MVQEGVKNAQLVQGDNHKEISLQQCNRFKAAVKRTLRQISANKKTGDLPGFFA